MKDLRTERINAVIKVIRNRIQERGLKQLFVAEQIGMNRRQFNDLLCGRKLMTADTLLQLVEVLQIDLKEIKR